MNMFTGAPVAVAESSERVAFIRRTYSLVALAVLALIGVEIALFKSGIADTIVELVLSHRMAWLGVMALFMLGSFIAQTMAYSPSQPTQYLGLGLLVLVWSFILVPILWIAQWKTGGTDILIQAGTLTLVIFGGLTLSVFISGRDFSFMGTALTVLGFGALAVIVLSILTGATLGLWFSFAMVALACGYIIYDTSNIMLKFPVDGHVGAATALFGSVMLLFYYILMIFLSREE